MVFPTALVLGAFVTGAAPTSVAVMSIEAAGGASPELAVQLTARVAGWVGRRPSTTVITPDDIRALIRREEQRQRLGCSDQECLAEIAGALGADRLIAGRVTRLEEGWSLALTMIDPNAVKALSRVTETWGGPSLGLLDLVEPMVASLFSDAPEALAGAIVLAGVEDGSEVLIDDRLGGTAPIEVLRAVPVGGRRLRVTNEDFFVFEEWVVVRPGRRIRVVVDQVRRPERPVYAKWWFWTLMAAGVAGGTVAAVALTGGDDGAGQGNAGIQIGVNVDDAIRGGR